MAEPVFYGICANCIHARTCRYSLNAARPVHFCDHYEVNGTVPDNTPWEAPVMPDAAGSGNDRQFKGLCIDCLKRHDCERAGVESGVWRCEEYQGEPRSTR